MSVSMLQAGLFLFAAAVLGGIIGGLTRGRKSSHDLNRLSEEWQTRFDAASRQKEKLSTENRALQSQLENEHGTVQKHKQAAVMGRTELDSLREKSTTLSKNLFAQREECKDLNDRLSKYQGSLDAAKERIKEQHAEFAKARDFYKAQLENALDERTALERKNERAKSEHESLRNLLMSAKSEHESVNKLLESAQSRLENLDALEKNVVSLEAENAELRQAATQSKREAESLKRDVSEMNALKAQNRELAHCLKSMETSRKQYESDALRYRSQYEQSERESETLRFKIGDIEKNWAELQRSDKKAQKTNSEQDTSMPAFGIAEPKGETDNLTDIIGIGKVFERTLHDLGIYYFRQIASFGPAELARVNAELKEFKGRIEHDDWIGQAKELHFKKYGGDDKH